MSLTCAGVALLRRIGHDRFVRPVPIGGKVARRHQQVGDVVRIDRLGIEQAGGDVDAPIVQRVVGVHARRWRAQ